MVVIFWIMLAFVALIAAIAIPNFLRARLKTQEGAARGNIKTMAAAFEAYRAANNGTYPLDETALVNAEPPYLWRTYDNETVAGYTFSVRLALVAIPLLQVPKNVE